MAKKKAVSKSKTPVESIRHGDSRPNIPTEELRDFYQDVPQTVLYARDTSLDPQLVWRGKDQQDAQPLAVPVLPIYIQEKIHPQALIEDLQARAEAGASNGPQSGDSGHKQLDLFADFNGIDDFQKKIDFYRHDSHWTNRMILGDSLAVMTSLAEKEGLKGQVQMIYLDPPYGIKFGSNWQVSTRKRDVKDGKAEDASRQPEQVKAFRDTWELGIHSYLAYLRDRLVSARELLTESGSVFVQIGDENVHLVRSVMDEVFGPENFVSLITFRTTANLVGNFIGRNSDYILWFAKEIAHLKYRQIYKDRTIADDVGGRYTRYELPIGTRHVMNSDQRDDVSQLPKDAMIYRHDNLTSQGATQSGTVWFEFQGIRFHSGDSRHWTTNADSLKRLGSAHRLAAPSANSLAYVRYLKDFPVAEYTNVWTDTQTGAFTDDKVYVVQTNTKVIERCLLMATDPGDLVFDPTCGSGTTAHVAEQWGRRWITCDTSRVALALARTRLMAAKFPFYYPADCFPQIPQRAADDEIKFHLRQGPKGAAVAFPDIRKGFVYKRVPHVTLKSIANNDEIDTLHAKFQLQLEPLRAEINRKLGTAHAEWEMPREVTADRADVAAGRKGKKMKKGEGPPESGTTNGAAAEPPHPQPLSPEYGGEGSQISPAQSVLAQYWDLRRRRQQEIDASIARRADQEFLFDQPYEDHSRVRVAGPFTVESLSPHRRLTVADKKARATGKDGLSLRTYGPDQFGTMIIDNLRKAGIQARDKKERLKFDLLEPFAGEWIHAAGEFTDSNGDTKRVAVCIGPEHGTVGPQLIKEAAKEAIRGVGFDLLYVCGFAFDPHVGEEQTRYGKLRVEICRMNPDLSMGDELLKKTGAGNLFMVFGEPDVEIRTTTGEIIHSSMGGVSKKMSPGKSATSGADLVVEIQGVDVYDPTTGAIRSHSTDDIACWFIDTAYDGESFFVRHAYFTGADQPYDKLKRALRAEINEEVWASLYATVSQPFPSPKHGKIAVKVINHYGDEVLKVYSVK